MNPQEHHMQDTVWQPCISEEMRIQEARCNLSSARSSHHIFLNAMRDSPEHFPIHSKATTKSMREVRRVLGKVVSEQMKVHGVPMYGFGN